MKNYILYIIIIIISGCDFKQKDISTEEASSNEVAIDQPNKQITSDSSITNVIDSTSTVENIPHEIESIEQFDKIIALDKPALIDFYTTWCGPCMRMAPYFAHIQETKNDKVNAIKVDIDKFPKLAERYLVESIPRLIAFKQSKIILDEMGYKTLPQLEEMIEKIK